MGIERRIHPRASVHCKFTLLIGDSRFSGTTNNLSLGGARVRIESGESDILGELDQGYFSMEYHNEKLDMECQLLRIASDYIAMQFINLDVGNSMRLRRIVEENGAC